MLTVDVRFHVQAANTQDAVDSVMLFLPALYPTPTVQTNVTEYDLHSVNDQEVYVSGFDTPYRITKVTEGGE